MSLDISGSLVTLINSDRFYADMVMQLNRVYTKTIPTMTVSLKGGGTLVINPDFWNANFQHVLPFLQHECLHLLMNHFGRMRETEPTPLFNIAADLAINEIIPNFPDTAIIDGKPAALATVKNFQKQFPDLLAGQAFEYYYDFLKKKQNEGDQGTGRGGGQTVDDHSGWAEEIEKMSPAEAEAVVRRMVASAVEATKFAGKQVPPVLRPFIEALNQNDETWERVLESVPEATEVAFYESSRKRRNRRYGTDFPGERVVRKCEVVVGLDVSGSIGDEILQKLVGVMDTIKQKANVTVLVFDHQIEMEAIYEPGIFNNGVPGGGGTLFKPVFERAVELGADALIMLTDGLCADQFDKPQFPVFWGILEGYKSPVDWGRTVEIK